MATSVRRNVPWMSLYFFVIVNVLICIQSFVAVSGAGGEEQVCDGGTCSKTDGKEPEDPCKDYHENCALWESAGECENNPIYMKTHCLLSCKVCLSKENTEEFSDGSRKETEVCEDLHEMCPSWSEKGECMINPIFMQSACRKSCYLCVDIIEARRDGDDEDLM